MPLRDDLMNPIPGDNPSGVNLRYRPVYDMIREARREEDDISAGAWIRERKTADWKRVIALAGEALATQSKDLTLAAWLTEALIKTEGFSGFRQGLDLLAGLIEEFWDTLYPEIEDGDIELRAVPLEWIGEKFDALLKTVPLTQGGLDWNAYRESRVVGYESDAEGDSLKTERRRAAVNEGKCTPEQFDEQCDATAKSFYVRASDDLSECRAAIRRLETLCDAKFGSEAPRLWNLRSSLEEIQSLVKTLLNRKRQYEPDQPTELEEAPPGVYQETVEAEVAPAEVRRAPPTVSLEPANRAEAIARIAAAAAYLRNGDPYNPASYLLLRALRWGELRAGGRRLDPALLIAPPTALRMTLKTLAAECKWLELLSACESAMAEEHGRAWLDLQRFSVHACEKLGPAYLPIANAVRSELARLLAEFPDLPDASLSDDTPAAGAETRTWIRESLGRDSLPALGEPMPDARGLDEPHDRESPYVQALGKAEAGLHEEAVALISAEVSRGPDGRSRFRAKLQLADICMRVGYIAMAKAVLEELVRTIDEHQLETWESPGGVARVLSMFYRCLSASESDPARKEEVYSRLCRLDPRQAPPA